MGAMAETMRENVAIAARSFSRFGAKCSMIRNPASSRSFASSIDPSSRNETASS